MVPCRVVMGAQQKDGFFTGVMFKLVLDDEDGDVYIAN